MTGNGPLRVCQICGLEAHTTEELALFSKHPQARHGRLNKCLKCFAKKMREYRQKNPERSKETNRRSRLKHRDKLNAQQRERHKNRITFKGCRLNFKENPRRNICSVCGKRYPEELERQTCFHHLKYDAKDPLAHTVEMCGSCHMKLHSPNLPRRRENYGRVISVEGNILIVEMRKDALARMKHKVGTITGHLVRVFINTKTLKDIKDFTIGLDDGV